MITSSTTAGQGELITLSSDEEIGSNEGDNIVLDGEPEIQVCERFKCEFGTTMETYTPNFMSLKIIEFSSYHYTRALFFFQAVERATSSISSSRRGRPRLDPDTDDLLG